MAQQINRLQGQPLVTQAPSISGGRPTQQSILSDIAPFIEAFQVDSINRDNAAQKHYLKTISLNAKSEAQKIGGKNSRTPVLMRKEAEEYLSGLNETIPDKVLRAEIGAIFNDTLIPFVNKSNVNVEADMKAASLATSVVKQSVDDALLIESADGVFSDPIAEPGQAQASGRGVDRLRAELITELSAHGSRPDGSVFPLFGKDVLAQRLNHFNDTWISTGIIGAYNRSPDQDKMFLDLLEGLGPQMPEVVERKGPVKEGAISEQDIRQDTVNVRAINKLSPEARTSLLKGLSDRRDFEFKLSEKSAALTKKRTIKNQQITGAALVTNLKTAPQGEKVTPKEIIFMGEINNLDPSKLEGYIKLATEVDPVTDNPDLVKSFQFAVDAGVDITDLLSDPLISAEFTASTYTSLSEENSTNLEIAAGTRTGPLNSEIAQGLSVLKSGIPIGSGEGRFTGSYKTDQNAVFRRMDAIKSYQIRTQPVIDPETGRPGPPAERPIDVAEDLVRRGIATLFDTASGADILLPLSFEGTRASITKESLLRGVSKLDARFKSGDLGIGKTGKRIYDRNSVLYAEWLGLLPAIEKMKAQKDKPTKESTGAIPPRATKK